MPDTSHSTSAGDKGQGGRKYIPPNARNGGSHSGMGDDSGGGQGENGDVRTMDKKISRNEPSALAADSQTHSNKGTKYGKNLVCPLTYIIEDTINYALLKVRYRLLIMNTLALME